MTHPPATSRPAFTLIELILVMVIISILIAVASPALSRLNRGQRIDGLARTLVALHEQARGLAMRDGRSTRLVIDPDEHEVWIELEQPGGYAEVAESWGRRIAIDKTITLSFEGATRDGDTYTFACRANGVVQPGRVELLGASGREVRVETPSASEGFVIAKADQAEPDYEWGDDDVESF